MSNGNKDKESQVPMLDYYSTNRPDSEDEEQQQQSKNNKNNNSNRNRSDSISPLAYEAEEEPYLNRSTSRNSASNNNSARIRKSSWITLSIFSSGILGLYIGSRRSIPGRFKPESVMISLGNDVNSECNPYEQPGVLKVDVGRAEGNMWDPIFSPSNCQPVDYLTRLKNNKDVSFARNKLIVIYGDSVDRGHNEDLCNFIGGKRERISDTHSFSPPYPKGFEFTHPGYENHEYGESKTWPDNGQSRPYLCTHEKLNFHILNVFHYGFLPVDGFINHHPHYYPPGLIEDRVDNVILPLVEKITKAYSLDPVPSLISVSPGFWDILRLSIEKNELRNAAIREGMSEEVARTDVRWDRFQVMDQQKREYFTKRIEETIRHIASAWDSHSKTYQGETNSFWSPRILYRSLHHVQFYDDIPYVQVQALDQIGKAVVSKLILEGTPLITTKLAKLRKRISNLAMIVTGGKQDIEASVKEGLGRRLKLDEWGVLMLGQENHFKDPIHPAALPGSYLYGNMLLLQLKMAVEAEQQQQ